MSDVNKQLLDALKRLLHKAYKQNWQDNYPFEVECAEEAIAAAEQATLCASCARADVNCHIYPQQTASCVEHRPSSQQQAEPVQNAKLATAIQQADLAEVAAEAERRQADPGRPQAVGFFSGWVEGGEDGQPVEFMVTAYGEVPPAGAKLYTQPPAQQQLVATQLVCDALVAIVAHSGDPAGTVAALAEWRKKAEVFTSKPAAQPPAVAVTVPDERAAFEEWLQENIDDTDTVRPSKEKVDAYFTVWLARAMLAAAKKGGK